MRDTLERVQAESEGLDFPLETDIAFLPHANDNSDTLAFLRKTTTVPREGGCT